MDKQLSTPKEGREKMIPKERKCPECKGVVSPGQTELVYELAGLKITVKNVSGSVCSKCGQSFISGRVAEEVNRLVNRITEDINSFVKTQPQVSEGRKEVAIAV
jgi:YgiT-type zinc finger domain-containing protein